MRDEKGRFLPQNPSEVVREQPTAKCPPKRIDTVETERYALVMDKLTTQLVLFLIEDYVGTWAMSSNSKVVCRKLRRIIGQLREALGETIK